jgi:hypothetical protein
MGEIGFAVRKLNAEDDIDFNPIVEKLFALGESGKGGEWKPR